jgi:hypothetical protein
MIFTISHRHLVNLYIIYWNKSSLNFYNHINIVLICSSCNIHVKYSYKTVSSTHAKLRSFIGEINWRNIFRYIMNWTKCLYLKRNFTFSKLFLSNNLTSLLLLPPAIIKLPSTLLNCPLKFIYNITYIKMQVQLKFLN